MTDLDPTTLDHDDLAAMLRCWAQGSYPAEAAVELLIAHGIWLRRRAFLTACVTAVDDGWLGEQQVPMAFVDFDAAHDFATHAAAGSGSELGVLRIAIALAHDHGSVTLSDALSSLDRTSTTHVLNAIARRCGWYDHSCTVLVTGHPAAGATTGWEGAR